MAVGAEDIFLVAAGIEAQPRYCPKEQNCQEQSEHHFASHNPSYRGAKPQAYFV